MINRIIAEELGVHSTGHFPDGKHYPKNVFRGTFYEWVTLSDLLKENYSNLYYSRKKEHASWVE